MKQFTLKQLLLFVALCGVGNLGYQLSQLSLFSCKNGVIREHLSPDRSRKLVVFDRNCGATTGFDTQISLVSGNDALADEPGNVFIADTDHGKAPAWKWGGPEVRITWLGVDVVRIEHHPDARIFSAERSVAGIAIQYQTFSANVVK